MYDYTAEEERMAAFAMPAAAEGGTFEASVRRSQVFRALRECKVELVRQTNDCLIVHPIHPDGHTGDETIKITVSPGTQRTSRITIEVDPYEPELDKNLPVFFAVAQMLDEIVRLDSYWQPA